eukprot:TRINITY_DN16091_c0_g1_i1.p1 TRINITY_DN16091_c0_g1~~TRINITY_DN16091_c0_g1_i1.p1  ORF type:complete len:526 (+),score=138.67 TRINITY_DN16091_c0_g1_i1:41-1579(+)
MQFARVLQRRGCKTLADNLRANGFDETVAYSHERKRLLQDSYHFADSAEPRDEKFDQRLKVFSSIYDQQELHGECIYALNKELDGAEKAIYRASVQTGKPVKGEQQVQIFNRLKDARSRLLRKYKGIDADLRGDDPELQLRAKDYLYHIQNGGGDTRWDYNRAAHLHYGTTLQGTQEDVEQVAADNEMSGLPDAEPDILNTIDELGFIERDEFAILRREVGEEAADEFITNLTQARREVVKKRLQTVQERARLHQLEKRILNQEYKTVFDIHYRSEAKAEKARSRLQETTEKEEILKQLENELSLDGSEGFNAETHEMQAEAKKRRMDKIRERRAAEGIPKPKGETSSWGKTTGLVQNTRSFVDPDWWELATADPTAKRSFRNTLKRDVRSMRHRDNEIVSSRNEVADEMLSAMDQFNKHRSRNFDRGFASGYSLEYNDPRLNEPDNMKVQMQFPGSAFATGTSLKDAGIKLPSASKHHLDIYDEWNEDVANTFGRDGQKAPVRKDVFPPTA